MSSSFPPDITSIHAPELFQMERGEIEKVATSGFSILVNYTRAGPEFFESSYDADWQERYELQRYYLKDPVLLWGMMSDGDWRWSDVKIPDIGGVMRDARRYGLVYGAIFARSVGRNKSLLGVAREDRELTDEEMEFIAQRFSRFVDAFNRDNTITAKELEVLQCMANDMDLKDAAKHLGVSTSAVKARLKSARARLGCNTNYMAIAAALRAKLIR